jgi:hypothetical protein
LKKRKASYDCWEDDQALGLAPMHSNEEDKATPPKSNTEGSRKGSDAAMSKTSSTALDHLDALGADAALLSFKQKEKKVATTKSDNAVVGDEESSQNGTLASSNQRVLLEAIMSTVYREHWWKRLLSPGPTRIMGCNVRLVCRGTRIRWTH